MALLQKGKNELVSLGLCKSKELLTTEHTEGTESIDFVDSFLCALCGLNMLLHSPKTKKHHSTFCSRVIDKGGMRL